MYRWPTRAAAALIALEVLALACGGTAYADTEPQGALRPAASAWFGVLDVYPREGTSYAQQARDQYECDIAAEGQTGFNPTVEDGGLPPDVAAVRQADYLRAEAACLEARGYRVKILNAQT